MHFNIVYDEILSLNVDSLVFSLQPLYNPNPVLQCNEKFLFSLQPSICSIGKLNFVSFPYISLCVSSILCISFFVHFYVT